MRIDKDLLDQLMEGRSPGGRVDGGLDLVKSKLVSQ